MVNAFDEELEKLKIQMKHQVLDVLFYLFLHELIGKKGHNVLTFMLDLRFWIIWLVISYVGHKDASMLVGEYDNCYCCLYWWSITSCWCPMWLKGLPASKDLASRDFVGFHHYFIDVDNFTCALTWCIQDHKLTHHCYSSKTDFWHSN